MNKWTVFIHSKLQRERVGDYEHTLKNDNRRLYEKRLREIQSGQAGPETPERNAVIRHIHVQWDSFDIQKTVESIRNQTHEGTFNRGLPVPSG